jgi:hypothetical protein
MYTGSVTPFLAGFADELVKLSSVTADGQIKAKIDLKGALKDARREAKAVVNEPEVQSTFSRIIAASRPKAHDYLRSAMLGAALTPVAALASRAIFRAVRNREVRQAMRHLSARQARKRAKDLQTGPILGREIPLKKMKGQGEPILSYPGLFSAMGTGALYGGAFQAIRDRLLPGSSAAPGGV